MSLTIPCYLLYTKETILYPIQKKGEKVSNNERDLDAIKEELIERLADLEEELKKLSTEKITDDQVQDPGDQALSSTMENLRTSLQNTELQEYKRIVQAIEKINNGTYGICIDCSEDISPKRLSFYPNAARCLACQETFEDRR